MKQSGKYTYVGFGFGAIQAGLFLYEAFRAGSFGRLVVAEVVPETVKAVNDAERYFSLNIAHKDGIEKCKIGQIEIYDPLVEKSQKKLIEAVSAAHEISTAVPSVKNYVSIGAGSIHRILAEGLSQKVKTGGHDAVIYCAENHNYAAEILKENIMAEIPESEHKSVCSKVQFLDTVVGKMSGVISDKTEIAERNLATITPDMPRAFLVEEFSRIFISRIELPSNFIRVIRVFEEKDDLMPFCEAKLYGHNATHALAGYIGAMLGVKHIAELKNVPGILPFLREAFIEESGTALIRKHKGKDPLFTPNGYRAFADDLLERMTNPFLRDSIERVTREPERKLGWDDRLIGTMRLALSQGIQPKRYAFGAAASLIFLEPILLESDSRVEKLLKSIWRESAPDAEESAKILHIIKSTILFLRKWRELRFPNLAEFFANSSAT